LVSLNANIDKHGDKSPEDYHTYTPAGQCIYCRTTVGQLSKEHIVPYALNGNWVLPAASCLDCAKITSKIEEVCTRERSGMLFPFRAKLRMQSRKSSTNQENISTEIVYPDGRTEEGTILTTDFPATLIGVKLPVAGILSGQEPTNQVDCQFVISTAVPGESFKPDAAVLSTRFSETAWIQLIAKIGYSYAAAELGVDALSTSVTDIVLGKTDKTFYLVGGSLEDQGVKTTYLHRLELHRCTISGIEFTIVFVHLFGQFGMPRYHVVVSHRAKS
jgi:hypothetical protein